MNKKNILKTMMLSSMLLTSAVTITGCGEEDLKISLTAGDVVNVNPGSIVQLTSQISDPEYGLPTYTIVEGADYVTVSATGVVTISNSAPNNATIKIKAKIGDVESNEISLKVVVVEATSVTISANSTQLERNQETQITATVAPTDATNKIVSYEITAGSEYATLSSTGVLKVNGNAPVDAVIKVKATLSNLESNELSFTVTETAESEFEVTLLESTKTLDSTTNQASYTLQPTVFDADGKRIQNAVFAYEVFSGVDVVNVSSTGVVTPVGHGEAKVRVSVVGSNAYAECTFNSIVPPKVIEFADEYDAKTRYGYGQGETMPFAVSGKGSTDGQKVANTFKYEFFLDNATDADNTLATYDDDTDSITFAAKTVGHKVKIVVTSDTGATKETSKSFVVDVNNGINVRNMDQLLTTNNGVNKVINLVGDCVVTNDEVVNAATLSKYLLRYSGNFTFYGNGHKIDFTDVVVNHNQTGGNNEYIKIDNTGSVTDNVVKIYNLDIRGNVGVDATYSGEKGPWYGGFTRGLYIKGANRDYVDGYLSSQNAKPGHTDIEMDDIRISGFRIGLKVDFAIDSEISNLVLEDNHQGGAEVTASELTFTNVRLGKNGTTGIELTPDASKLAGENFSDSQQIKFKGVIDCSNNNAFTTPYMANDALLSKLHQVLQGLGVGLTDAQRNAFFNTTDPQNTSINWALLIFDNPTSTDPNELENQTQVTFENVTGGTFKNVADIDDADLPNYKFLSMDIVVDAGALGMGPSGMYVSLGKIVVLNQNYN